METSEKAYEGVRNALGSNPQYRAYALPFSSHFHVGRFTVVVEEEGIKF
jgi:hypothetical protein